MKKSAKSAEESGKESVEKMRLIDADALAKKLTDWSTGTVEPIDWSDIAEAPTIDAVEVVCGEWIDKGWKGDWQFETDGRGNCWYEYECSECGFHKKGSKSNYCPNCGVRMKGVDDEIFCRRNAELL